MKQLFLILKKSIPGIALCLGLGSLSSLAVRGQNLAWYASLIKPSFNPPSYLFGPVWTVLYILMGIGLTIVWNDKNLPAALPWLFALQLTLNLLWSPIFFYLQRIDLALVVIIGLWLTLIALMALSRPNKLLVALWIPYVLWVSFASILNLSIYLLN